MSEIEKLLAGVTDTASAHRAAIQFLNESVSVVKAGDKVAAPSDPSWPSGMVGTVKESALKNGFVKVQFANGAIADFQADLLLVL